MKRVTIEQILRDVRWVSLDPQSSYLISYPQFLAYFAKLEAITVHEFVIGAMFTYGWMPTQLNFKSRDFAGVVSILNQVKLGSRIDSADLQRLQSMLNNSLVGPSKLLHFICPQVYPMWDTNVCAYIDDTAGITDPDHYLLYVENCHQVAADTRFKPVREEINRQCGYEVSPCRAVELVMFENGRRKRGRPR